MSLPILRLNQGPIMFYKKLTEGYLRTVLWLLVFSWLFVWSFSPLQLNYQRMIRKLEFR